MHCTKISPELELGVKGQGHQGQKTNCWVHWQCMVRRHVRCRPYAECSSRRLHCVTAEGDSSAHWQQLACIFVGSGPYGCGYAGGKISAFCLVHLLISALYIYTVVYKKRGSTFVAHNSGKTRLIFIIFCTAVSRKNIFVHTRITCSPHLNNVVSYLLKLKHHVSYFYNALLEYLPTGVALRSELDVFSGVCLFVCLSVCLTIR